MKHLLLAGMIAAVSGSVAGGAAGLPPPALGDGEAKPGYAFIAGDLAQNRIVKYGADGQPFWVYGGITPVDVWALDDGTVLAAYLPSKDTAGKSGVRLIGADKKTIFDFTFDDEIFSVQPLEDGNLLLAESHKGLVTEIDRTGKRIRSFPVVSKPSGHSTMRHVRLSKKGTVFVAEYRSGKIREYDRGGKLLRELDQKVCVDATPLPGGGLLASCWSEPDAKIVEYDAAGKAVWTLLPSDLPAGFDVNHLAESARLKNGNTLVTAACYHKNPAIKKGVPRAYIFEVTPQKKVLWKIIDPKSATRSCGVKVIPEAHLKTAVSERKE